MEAGQGEVAKLCETSHGNKVFHNRRLPCFHCNPAPVRLAMVSSKLVYPLPLQIQTELERRLWTRWGRIKIATSLEH